LVRQLICIISPVPDVQFNCLFFLSIFSRRVHSLSFFIYHLVLSSFQSIPRALKLGHTIFDFAIQE
jgi:hypothetical protein